MVLERLMVVHLVDMNAHFEVRDSNILISSEIRVWC